MTDRARQSLVWALDNATERVERATRTIVRYVCGGLAWTDDRVRQERAKLERALIDQAIAGAAMRELNAVDGVTGGA